MTATELRMIGECLYGELWQSQLARALGVNDRTVRRWAIGKGAPGTYASAMIGLLAHRRAAIDDALAHLATAV